MKWWTTDERPVWALLRPDGDGSGGDGLGGDAVAVEDPIQEDPDYSAAPEFEPDPVVTAGPPDQRDDDPWAGFDDETRRKAEQKGWDSPAAMVKSYSELEGKLGQRSDQSIEEVRAEMRQMAARHQSELDALRSSQPAPSPFPQPEGDPIAELFSGLPAQELDQLAETHGAGAAIAAYQDQWLLPKLRQVLGGVANEIMGDIDGRIGSRIQPLEQGQTTISLRDQARSLASEFPNDWPQLREQVQAIMQRDRSLLTNPEGMRRAFERAYVEKARADEARRARGDEGEALTGGRRPGGDRGPQTRAAEDEALRQAIEGARPTMRDGLG